MLWSQTVEALYATGLKNTIQVPVLFHALVLYWRVSKKQIIENKHEYSHTCLWLAGLLHGERITLESVGVEKERGIRICIDVIDMLGGCLYLSLIHI